MKTPAIFLWPSPWIWGALGVLMLTGAEGPLDILRTVAVVALMASVVFVIRNRTSGRRSGTAATTASTSAVDDRLLAIERRLTDTQDVMIALSEKVDQWEAERARGVTTPAQPS